MKIGIICQNYPPASFEGGISHYSRQLAEGLFQQGHDVYALTSTEFTKPPYGYTSTAIVKLILIKGPWNYFTVGEIKSIVKDKGLEAIILQFSPASFIKSFRIAWSLTRFQCQKITAFHTLWGKGLDRGLSILTLLGSRKIIATNSEIMFLLERYLPHFLSKTYWIPIGSNILPPPHGDDVLDHPSRSIISYFGMLYPGKGLDLILDCLQELKKRDYSFSFKFIGGGMLDHEQYEADFQSKIAARGLQNDVEHLGLLSNKDVSRWLLKSRFVFLPYDKGFSDRRGTLMAALAHGKAVLTSPPVINMPCFKNGVNICWPQKNSIGDYLELMERFLCDDELVASLEAGARHLAFFFDWDQIVSDYELVIRHR